MATISRSKSPLKGRFIPDGKEAAEKIAQELRANGSIAWVEEEWGSDHGHHSFWGYRVVYLPYETAKALVSEEEDRRSRGREALAVALAFDGGEEE